MSPTAPKVITFPPILSSLTLTPTPYPTSNHTNKKNQSPNGIATDTLSHPPTLPLGPTLHYINYSYQTCLSYASFSMKHLSGPKGNAALTTLDGQGASTPALAQIGSKPMRFGQLVRCHDPPLAQWNAKAGCHWRDQQKPPPVPHDNCTKVEANLSIWTDVGGGFDSFVGSGGSHGNSGNIMTQVPLLVAPSLSQKHLTPKVCLKLPTNITILLDVQNQSHWGCHILTVPGPTPCISQSQHKHLSHQRGIFGMAVSTLPTVPIPIWLLSQNQLSHPKSHCHLPMNLLSLAKLFLLWTSRVPLALAWLSLADYHLPSYLPSLAGSWLSINNQLKMILK